MLSLFRACVSAHQQKFASEDFIHVVVLVSLSARSRDFVK